MPEAVVARFEDLQNGEMKQVSVGETDVLLARIEDAYHALHAYCTHYGAPLADGALSGDRVVCPWHHACFRVTDGTQLEPPGLDSLPRFEVRIDGDDVVVRVPDDAQEHRVVEMARRDAADDRTFAVVGAGAAGAYAVEALRQSGYAGRVVVITREAYTPYDRPNCSKEYLQGEAPEEWMYLRPDAFYAERDIELLRERDVTHVDVESKTVAFKDGSTLEADGLVLCTGGRPRTLDVPGAGLDRVHTLRSLDDSDLLMHLGDEVDRVVVVGASFIGMEAAFSMRKHGCDVTVVAPEDVPFARVFGERVGRMIQTIHEENGVAFRLGKQVDAFEGEGRVERVRLNDGSTLDADLVIVGIGVQPDTDVIEGAEKSDDGGLVVDQYLRVADGVYAAGDIARFPDWRTGQPTRIEHWRLACQHGRIAGFNLAGDRTAYESVPYFWTAHFGTSLRYVGHSKAWDEVIYDGAPEDRSFIAYYIENGAIRAAAGVGRDTAMAAFEELMRRQLLPDPSVLKSRTFDPVAALKEAR